MKVGSRSVALRRVFDLKLRGIHLTEIIFKVWVINGQNFVDVSICEVELNQKVYYLLLNQKSIIALLNNREFSFTKIDISIVTAFYRAC